MGLGGVSYMFYHLANLPAFQALRQEYLKNAKDFLEIPLQVAIQGGGHITDRTGFLTGNIGVYVVAAVVYNRLGKNGLLLKRD